MQVGRVVLGVVRVTQPTLTVAVEEVLDDPTKNTRENLEFRIENLGKMDMDELQKLSEKAREKKEEFESGVEEEMKKKYYVK